jgi:hypothetical protein
MINREFPVEAVKCPHCQKAMQPLEGKGSFRFRCDFNAGGCCFSTPQLADKDAAVSWVKRLTIAPESLRCPVCGKPPTIHRENTTGDFWTRCDCGISGAMEVTEQAAEQSFRDLRYEVNQ